MIRADIGELLQKAIQQEVTRIIEEEVQEAPRRIQERIRGRIGQITAQVLEHFSMERQGSEIVIRVNFEEMKK